MMLKTKNQFAIMEEEDNKEIAQQEEREVVKNKLKTKNKLCLIDDNFDFKMKSSLFRVLEEG